MATTIFVCGATGAQGGAVVNHLLTSNIRAHAIARDLSSPASQALEAAGVALFKGDFDDQDSLRRAMQGCSGLFLNLMPTLQNVSHELVQAKQILSLAKEVGIEHVVYTSGFCVHKPERLHHWDPKSLAAKVLLGKQAIEREVRTAGFRYWTIIRPGNFMTNFLPPYVSTYAGLVEKGEFSTAFTPETVLPMIDTDDIGKFGVAAFLDPVRFHAKEFEIASELLKLEDILRSLSTVTGRDLKVDYMSQEDIDSQLATNPVLAIQLLGRDMVKCVDMDEVRAWGIPLNSFEQFLEREKDLVVKAYSVPP